MSSPSSEALPGSGSQADARLESWKQIAAHLGRDVRTAQRWEKTEGLPVHRHQHTSRGTVFAYRAELDGWLRGRTAQPEFDPEPEPEPELPAPPLPEPARPRRRPAAVALAGLVAVLLAGLGLFRWARGGGAVDGALAGTASARVLVLPFEVVPGGAPEEAASHGMHEELITRIARLAPARLDVIGRTSAMRYGETGLTLAEIGDELGVDHVLEGSVRRRAGELVVTARLVQAADQSEVWSRSFRADDGGVAQLEARVVREVSESIGRELLGLDPILTSAGSSDPRARDAWLRGQYLWHKGTRAGFRASIPHYEAALELDPSFVAAHVGLANAYNLLGRYGSLPAEEAFPLARASAERALGLDPDAAEAHAALALVRFYYEWDFAAAAGSFRTALRLAPELALTHHAYAHFLSCLGLHEEGLREVRRARALEPLWPLVIADTAWFHYRAHDFEAAAAESRRALELEPHMYSALKCLVESLRRTGDERGAWAVMRSHLDARGELAEVPGVEGLDPAAALRSVRLWERALIEREAARGYVSAHAQVFSLTDLERPDEVLDWLEQGIEARDRVALLMRVHPAFDELRADARFQRLVDTVGFPEDPVRLVAEVAGG